MSVTVQNPIMPGFYPDPSLCAVGGDFYMVHSSFAYFPGLPVMHSRDLCHWEQIGNAMDRKEQLPLEKAGLSRGLFAPTIRFHEGTFYIICTNVDAGGNFIITAQNPEGPWSDPYYLEGADGIDPSLFFDEDGTCYYIGTHPNPAGCRYSGDWYIWIQELDLSSMKLVGEVHNVWNGAMRDVVWPEGPHLYKKDGYYYIVHAEGGTGPDHAVTVCRSRHIFGPYENNRCNPILTHRHLGKDYPVKYVGHADLFETAQGEWYMVMLAVRPLEGYTTMGRETFLAKVIWENGWPVVNPGVGMLTKEVEVGLSGWDPAEDAASFTERSGHRNCVPGSSRSYAFGGMKALGDEFLELRSPGEDMVRLTKKGLELLLQTSVLGETESPSYVAVRQQHHSFCAEAVIETDNLTGGRRAGLALVQDDAYHLRAELRRGQGSVFGEVILCRAGKEERLGGGALFITAPECGELQKEGDGNAFCDGDAAAGEDVEESSAVRLILEVSGLSVCVRMRAAARGPEAEREAAACAGGEKAACAEAAKEEVCTVTTGAARGSKAGREAAGAGEEEAACADKTEAAAAVVLCRDADIRALSTEEAGGFVGCTVGMYAAAERGDGARAVFRTFTYQAR